MSFKAAHRKLFVRFDEKSICENSKADCTCGRSYHINEKPTKCYFYKKKPVEKGKSGFKSDGRGVKKIKALKHGSSDNLDKARGDGFSMRIDGKLVEEFELAEAEFEFHLKVCLSILEANKARIKTSYANFFNIEPTVLPSIRALLADFNILRDLCELFDGIVAADFGEVLDEYDELSKQIGAYRETHKLAVSDDEESCRPRRKISKEQISRRNTDYLNSGRSHVVESRATRQQSEKSRYAIPASDIFVSRLFMEDFEPAAVEQFYHGQFIYGEFVQEAIAPRPADDEPERVVPLTYRDKNYYYLKKAAVKKKKIKKEAKAIIVDDSLNAGKKKKKKKKGKKQPDNESCVSVVSDAEALSHNKDVSQSRAASSFNLIPNIKHDISCGILEIKVSRGAEQMNPVLQVSKKPDAPRLIIEDVAAVEVNNTKPITDNGVDSRADSMPQPTGRNASMDDGHRTQHEKSFSAKPPVRHPNINVERFSRRLLRDRSEGNIASLDNKRSFTLTSDYNHSVDPLKRYSDYSNTNNHSLIRESSAAKSNHIIHHKRREKTRKKNNRTIEKKLKKQEASIERRFNKITERKARHIAGLLPAGMERASRRESEDRLTVSDARHEFMERVAGMLEVAADREAEPQIFQALNKSLQEELEWIREEKHHVVCERYSAGSAVNNIVCRRSERSAAGLGDLQEEFLEMIRREKLDGAELADDVVAPTKQTAEGSEQPNKADKKKKKKKKKKTKQAEEQQPAAPKLDKTLAPLRETVGSQTGLIRSLPSKKVRTIARQDFAFDINSDAEEKNEFTRMFEILESQTKRVLGSDLDKKFNCVVEGELSSAGEEQADDGGAEAARGGWQELDAVRGEEAGRRAQRRAHQAHQEVQVQEEQADGEDARGGLSRTSRKTLRATRRRASPDSASWSPNRSSCRVKS